MNSTQFFYEVNITLWVQFLESALEDEFSDKSRYIYGAILIVVFIVGVLGNLLTCVVIYSDRTLHTATNIYMFNLAVSDFVVSFAILQDLHQLVSGAFYFGWLGCKVHTFMVLCLFNNGVLLMTALAIKRYKVIICYPMKRKSNKELRQAIKAIVIVWLVAISESLLEVWTVGLVQCRSFAMCYTLPTRYARLLNGILGIICFAIPLIILVFVYSMIAIKVQANEKFSTNNKVFNHRGNGKKVNKLVVALTLSFLVCWTPFFMLRATIFMFNVQQLMKINKIWVLCYKLTMVNSWFSVVLNPLLFSLMSSNFRKSLKILWNRKRRPERVSTTTSSTIGIIAGNKL